MPEVPWLDLTSLGADVTIVLLFLRYLSRRDRDITEISKRCHQTQEAGHHAIRELAVAIMRKNGNAR